MAILTTEYLIVGNSAAGVTAAEHIRSCDSEGGILIVSREPYAAYGRPLISYLIEGKTTEGKIGFKDEGFYERLNLKTLFGPSCEVVSLDAEAHEATLVDGRVIAYGKCLIATGSVPFVPPIEGMEDKDNVFSFLTLDDAKAAGEAAKKATALAHGEDRNSRIVVIGGGLIGLKAAEALSYHADEVVVLELAPRILPAVLDGEGASLVQRQLEKHGIVCMPGVSAKCFLGEGRHVATACLTTGDDIACDLVVAAVGVRPNVAIAVEAGAEQGRGLVCGVDLQTSLADVFAAGDVVQVTDALDGSKHPLALWPNAIRQGKTAGLFMAGSDAAEPFEHSFAVNAVDFFEISLLTAGMINPSADSDCEIKVVADEGKYAKFVMKDDRLMGYILVNRPANAGIYTALIEQETPLSSLDDDVFENTPLNIDFPAQVRWARLHRCYPADRDERGWKEGGR